MELNFKHDVTWGSGQERYVKCINNWTKTFNGFVSSLAIGCYVRYCKLFMWYQPNPLDEQVFEKWHLVIHVSWTPGINDYPVVAVKYYKSLKHCFPG